MIKLNAAARIVQARGMSITAAFTEEQKTALRQHILPLLDSFTPNSGYLVNLSFALPEWTTEKFDPKKWDLPPNLKALKLIIERAAPIRAIVNAVVSKGSPAKRAMDLKEALRPRWARHDGPPEKMFPQLLKYVKKYKPTKLTPKGQAMMDALHSPYMKLLQKSWPFIVQECDREFHEILKQNGFTMLTKNSASQDDIGEAVKKILKGWTVTMGKERGGSGPEIGKEINTYTFVSPDGLSRIELGDRYDANEYSLRPSFKTKPDGGWYSWARTGIDDGSETFDDETPVEYAVEKMIEKMDKARAVRLEKETNGANFNFGPTSKLLSQDELAKAIDKIKGGGVYQVTPSGFGTGYSFSTRRGQWSRPASQELSDKVGKPVFYETFDHD